MSGMFNSGDSCGPSNPLQGLVKAGNVDRSHQQDKFGQQQQQAGSSGFRTVADRQPGQLQQDFEQFVGESRGLNQQQHHGLAAGASFVPPPQFHQLPNQQQGGPDWVRDFSGMSLEQRPMGQPIGGVAGGAGHMSNWHSEFLQQRQQTQPSAQGYNQIGGMTGYAGPGVMSMRTSGVPTTTQEPAMKEEAELAMFAAAFDQVEQQLKQDSVTKSEAGPASVEETVGNQADEGGAVVRETVVSGVEGKSEGGPEGVDENTELAQIARHIMTNMDQSNEKLQASNFMLLMQQLGSQSARLEGEAFVDSVTGTDVREQFIDADTQREYVAEVVQGGGGEFSQVGGVVRGGAESEPPAVEPSTREPLGDPLAGIADGALSGLSSFEAAQRSLGGVSIESWEEQE